jgi:hypothetical protein
VYEKVARDDAASAYVLHPLELPLSQFMRGRIRRIKLVEKSKLIFELMKYMKVPQIIYSRLWQDVGTPGVSKIICGRIIVHKKHKVQAG